MNFRL